MKTRAPHFSAAFALVLGFLTAAPNFVVAAQESVPPAVVKALEEVDKELAAFEERIKAEGSEVTKAAMKTRLVVLKQRRADLGKRFSPSRHAALLEDLRKDVTVTAKSPPSPKLDEGSARRVPTPAGEPVPSALATYQAEAAAAKARDEQVRAQREAELASQRRMEFARIDADLARLAAQIDSSTVGDAQRRAELNLRMRELEAQKRRLEMAPNPSGVDQLRLEIERQSEKTRP